MSVITVLAVFSCKFTHTIRISTCLPSQVIYAHMAGVPEEYTIKDGNCLLFLF